ncbi:tetratricopeptide repeat protein [Rhodocaloribacter sp.]
MKHSTVLALMLLSFAVITGLVFFGKSKAPPVTPVPAHADTDWSPPLRNGGRSETPNKDNVSHSFRVRMARLENRLKTEPKDTTALYELATLLQDAHRPDSAAVVYERYVRLHPGNHQAWLDLANCYAEAEQWTHAEQTMRGLLERYPDDPSALYNLGAIAANRGEMEAAAQWWTKAKDQQSSPEMATMAADALARITRQTP